ncbi:diguanylate cyclase domain-containing protein [Actinoplanes sp. NPDC051859]|uniref:diguanylate cyclase domain-containing protein n=1 Tax=Actinoplanes sp. NPDC051859 TaxID=3363909 RepID=UPI0037A45D47
MAAIVAFVLLVQVAAGYLPAHAAAAVFTGGSAIAALWATIGSVTRVRTVHGRIRAGWVGAAVAAGLWAICNTVSSAYWALGVTPDGPGIPDFAAFGAIVVLPVTLLLLCPKESGSGARLRRFIDGAAVSASSFLLAWHFVLQAAVAEAPNGALLALLIPLLVIVSGSVGIVVLSRSRADGANAVSLLAAGMALLTFANVLSLHNSTHDRMWYEAGVGAGYVAATLILAIASRAKLPRPDSHGDELAYGPWGALPYVPVALSLGAAAYVQITTGVLGAVLVWAHLGSAVLVLLRQFLGLRVNQRLLRDVREQRSQLAYQAAHDSLTGLVNRSAFTERAEAALATEAPGEHTGVVLIDLDGFKQVNDTLGHAAGDALLIEVAHRLRRAVRQVDTVARLGGDEFVILLPELLSVADADQAASRILAAFSEPAVIAGSTLRPGGSVGIAVTSSAGQPLDELLHHADLALYRAKREGKSRACRYGPADSKV